MAEADTDGHPPRASLDILTSITSPPPQPIDPQFSTKTHLAAVLLSSLVQSTSEAKAVARKILVGGEKAPGAEGHVRGSSVAAQFFVPADTSAQGESSASQVPEQANGAAVDDDEEEVSLMGILVEYLSLSFLVRSKLDVNQTASEVTSGEERQWVSSFFLYTDHL